MLVIAIIGILSTLATFGVNGYVARAKTAEAITNVGAIGRAVHSAAARLGAEAGNGAAPGLCGTSTLVPKAVRFIRAKKYQPDPAPGKDYNEGDSVTGWPCLRFSINSPQRYRYRYQTGGAPAAVGLPRRGKPRGVNAAHAWAAYAQGDLDGDGVYSWIVLLGRITDEQEVIAAPTFHIQDEEE